MMTDDELMTCDGAPTVQDLTGSTTNQLLTPGAVEFESDGMRALRFTDDKGDPCAVRVVSVGRAQVDWMSNDEWCSLSTANGGFPAAAAMPWLAAVWAEMREKPTAKESSEVAPVVKESLTVEAGDALEWQPVAEHHTFPAPGWYFYQDDSEPGNVGCRWFEAGSTIDGQSHVAGPVAEPGYESERASHAQEIAAHELDVKTSLKLQENYLARAEKAEAREAEKPGWSQYRDNTDEYVAECKGCGAELPGDGSEHTWADCVRFARDASKLDVDMQSARIAELETKLAELQDKSHPKDSDALWALQECLDDYGHWPNQESKEAGNYEACIRHMARLLKEKACLFFGKARDDIRGDSLSIPSDKFRNHHCEITIRALYPIGERIEAETKQ